MVSSYKSFPFLVNGNHIYHSSMIRNFTGVKQYWIYYTETSSYGLCQLVQHFWLDVEPPTSFRRFGLLRSFSMPLVTIICLVFTNIAALVPYMFSANFVWELTQAALFESSDWKCSLRELVLSGADVRSLPFLMVRSMTLLPVCLYLI